MTNSNTFGDDADAMASQHGEFLAGVLAMARISRVTVALESGTDAGPALLEAARLTGHAETCLLFEDWEEQPLAALLEGARQASANGALPPLADIGDEAQALQQLLHQAQARQRHSFLLILNRMERLLARPTHDPHYQAFEQALVALADDRELDLHLLLVMDESAEFLLTRLEHRMPGIDDGCLRIPAPGQPSSAADAGRPRRHDLAVPGSAENRSGASRDRSFGMLLERLTAKAPLEPAEEGGQTLDQGRPEQTHAETYDENASVASSHAAPSQPADQDASTDAPPPVHAPFAAATQVPDVPDVRHWDTREAPEHHDSQQQDTERNGHAAHTVSASSSAGAATAMPGVQSAAPAVRRRTWPLALGLLLAAGAGMLAWQRLPVSDDKGSTAATQTAAPAATLPLQPAPAPAPAPVPAATVADATQPVASTTQPLAPTAPAPSDPLAQAGKPPGTDKPSSALVSDKTAKVSAPAAATASTAATPAVVYVHVRDARERDQVQAQRRALGTHGIKLMEVKVMRKGPSVADLRYFHDEDRDEALAVQKALLSAGVPVGRLSRMNGFEGSTRRRQYEAWLAGPGHSDQSRR
jgi:hypothetical protein